MPYEFKKWQDFNNLSIKITIKRKIYDAILVVDNNKLILKINMTKNIDEWRNLNKNYDIISGNFVFNNQKIFFINCISTGYSSSINCTKYTIEKATASFIVDRLILDKNISKTLLGKITKYSVFYKNLDLLSKDKNLMSSLKTFDYDSNTYNYKINTLYYSINILFYCSMTESRNSLSINKISQVKFNHSIPISINKVLENIYMLRNFLMIIVKEPVYVTKQLIYIDDNAVELFDCNNELLENNDLEERLFHRCLKLENIENIEKIYNNFINQYKQLFPLLELYYNVTQYKVPNLTRFINATTMLEYYSRNYNFDAALSLSKTKKTNCDDPFYIEMVKSLIINVNEIYNLTDNEIHKISENIKSARIYYIHYKTKQKSKPLTYDQQFWYSYFIQDIILLNIYKLLGLDISRHEYISFKNFYYDTYNLL